MSVQTRFNLIDEPWIPVVDVGLVSLKAIFTHSDYRALGGNPVQKIALTKLLLAITQAAYTPEDDEAWAELGVSGMTIKCLAYLDQWHDHFWLYGEQPFLQIPAVLNLIDLRTKKKLSEARSESKRQEVASDSLPKAIGTGFYPDVSSENNTVLSECHFDRNLSDAEKAVFIVSLMNFAFGGKRVEKDFVNFSGQVYGNRHSAKSGPSLGNYVGYLHSFLVGNTLLTTLWMNLLTTEKIEGTRTWLNGLGVPPWEKMPVTETCVVANALKTSYMGCLIGLCRFVYLAGDGIYYLDGIQYPSHKEGWREPSISVDASKEKLLWVDPQKRPWRELTARLSFINADSQCGMDCQQIRFGLFRARQESLVIGVWSGGLKVRGSSGDQSVKQDDDFVESLVMLPHDKLGSVWHAHLKQETEGLEHLGSVVYKATQNYFKDQNIKDSPHAKLAGNLFWQLCERKFQILVDVCEDYEQAKALRQTFANFANQAYDHFCPKDTARQLDAWAKNRPNLGKYLQDQTKTEEAPA